ncbi:MAG: hypothetical protein EZS28_005233 [Streblomastix strix]|uniref:Uncharacterized protein n=1 Tax=Streblomastix strix TaxID=222440 RepID=A0A5J4WXZ9_9EUKA|nr:MAG: hypothetical protein EZS28_005233 [Streblomastix strix]
MRQTFVYVEEYVDEIIKRKKEKQEQMGMKKEMNKLDLEEVLIMKVILDRPLMHEEYWQLLMEEQIFIDDHIWLNYLDGIDGIDEDEQLDIQQGGE